ncbi:DUF4294 domain-containing protein [uncultured Muribaculum sp.]|uniref:DUF4294 domain-containing protein n=1 Tax=uncultured Muribaculum sp. TaxID=1918613 RepID=UPI002599B5A9|nr:DUF4294 domain-containing protein [uncultured Muribaculum sp.]
MRLLYAIIIIMSFHVTAFTQTVDSNGVPVPPNPRQRPVEGRYHFVTEAGDTALMVVLNNITVFPTLKFKNKKQEEFYWRTVRDVKRTLPYAKLIAETLLETYEYIETFPTQKEREQYLSQMEKEIFAQYKPELKRFTKSQGKMLVKLINRETNQSSYSILKAFLGTFRAGFWQTFGHFFGVNLKSSYRPDKNKEDAIIERVCILVEEGAL